MRKAQKGCFPLGFFFRDVTRPISRVLSWTVIYLGRTLPFGSRHLLGTRGPRCVFLHGVAPDRVYRAAQSPARR